jgi:hypothetical protein
MLIKACLLFPFKAFHKGKIPESRYKRGHSCARLYLLGIRLPISNQNYYITIILRNPVIITLPNTRNSSRPLPGQNLTRWGWNEMKDVEMKEEYTPIWDRDFTFAYTLG